MFDMGLDVRFRKYIYLFTIPCVWSFLTNTHTVYQSYEETDNASCEDDDTDVPEMIPRMTLTE